MKTLSIAQSVCIEYDEIMLHHRKWMEFRIRTCSSKIVFILRCGQILIQACRSWVASAMLYSQPVFDSI